MRRKRVATALLQKHSRAGPSTIYDFFIFRVTARQISDSTPVNGQTAKRQEKTKS